MSTHLLFYYGPVFENVTVGVATRVVGAIYTDVPFTLD